MKLTIKTRPFIVYVDKEEKVVDFVETHKRQYHFHELFNDGVKIKDFESAAVEGELMLMSYAEIMDEAVYDPENYTPEQIMNDINQMIYKNVLNIAVRGKNDADDTVLIGDVEFVGALPKTFAIEHTVVLQEEQIYSLDTSFHPQADLTVKTVTTGELLESSIEGCVPATISPTLLSEYLKRLVLDELTDQTSDFPFRTEIF